MLSLNITSPVALLLASIWNRQQEKTKQLTFGVWTAPLEQHSMVFAKHTFCSNTYWRMWLRHAAPWHLTGRANNLKTMWRLTRPQRWKSQGALVNCNWEKRLHAIPDVSRELINVGEMTKACRYREQQSEWNRMALISRIQRMLLKMKTMNRKQHSVRKPNNTGS